MSKVLYLQVRLGVCTQYECKIERSSWADVNFYKWNRLKLIAVKWQFGTTKKVLSSTGLWS
jgi:hypothetical protein